VDLRARPAAGHSFRRYLLNVPTISKRPWTGADCSLTSIAMTTAAVLLAHQLAGRAFRDAAFLTVYPATALPMVTMAAAALTFALVPLFSRALGRFSALTVVSTGFALSGAGYVVEWACYGAGRWVVVFVYLHLAAVGALLFSGFWSIVGERFDPAAARAAYGRITAAGTAGGMLGSLAAERIAATIAPECVLILLAALHLLCATGVVMMRRAPRLLAVPAEPDPERSGKGTVLGRYLRTIGVFAILMSATLTIIEFLLKFNARASIGTGPDLLRFFALYYGTTQALSFVAQAVSAPWVSRLGISGTVNTLPAGAGAAAVVALVFPFWPVITMLAGVASVLRNSLFRNGYELLFVPLDARTRSRAKTTLDVLCDRAGEAVGSGIVQLVLIASVASISSSLLIATMILAAAAVWVGRRFSALYIDVVGQQLLTFGDAPLPTFASAGGWSVSQLLTPGPTTNAESSTPHAARQMAPSIDRHMAVLADLRSADAVRVTAALSRCATFNRLQVAQAVNLLARDALLPATRKALEHLAPAHVGLLADAMLDPTTDFAIRRRIPRILGTVASQRSLDAVVSGLDDGRFEVRHNCSRAIVRLLAHSPALVLDRARMIRVVERELSVPPQRWRGYRLLDGAEADESAPGSAPLDAGTHLVEHIVFLLSTFIAREPLDAAVHGVRSRDPGVRGLALEYLDQVLPSALVAQLRPLLEVVPPSSPPSVEAHAAQA
jgi:ATP:ADP antiporter, AAA family